MLRSDEKRPEHDFGELIKRRVTFLHPHPQQCAFPTVQEELGEQLSRSSDRFNRACNSVELCLFVVFIKCRSEHSIVGRAIRCMRDRNHCRLICCGFRSVSGVFLRVSVIRGQGFH